MENVKMLILDIDGTLIARGSETIRPAGVEALQDVYKRQESTGPCWPGYS